MHFFSSVFVFRCWKLSSHLGAQLAKPRLRIGAGYEMEMKGKYITERDSNGYCKSYLDWALCLRLPIIFCFLSFSAAVMFVI